MNLENYTSDLVERDGILFSKKADKVSYPETGNDWCFVIEQNSFWFKHRNNCIIEGVMKYCPENLFFDIGGGNGYVAKGLEEKGVSTVLVEPGIEGCLNARKRNLKNIVCSTFENASFKKNTIPTAGLFDVVEHIEKDLDFLKSVYEFVKDDGFIFITVPAFKALWSNEDDFSGHFRRYTTKELEDKLKSVGFVIEYSTYIFSVLTIAVFLFRSLPSKLGLNKNFHTFDKHEKSHENRKGIIDKMLNRIWKYEIKKIREGKKIPVGGSCFVIARKKSTG